MVKEYGPDEQGKQLFRMILVIVIGVGLWIVLVNFLNSGESSGPCEQYTTQEAFELCAESVYNG